MALEHVGLPVETIPEDPQRDHYEFLGWFRAKDCSEPNRVTLDSYLIEDSMTLYAGWKPVEYAISYELNGGENAPANPLTHNIESDSLPVYALTRTGYTFLGWDVSGIDALGVTEDGGVFIPAGSVGDITLTANWEPTVYSISYNLIRGETAGTNPESYTIEDGDIVLINPAADGYEFTGWTGTDLADKTETVVIPAGSVGNRSYKATWRSNDPIEQIVETALEAIDDAYTLKLSEFNGVTDIVPIATAALAAEESGCSDYIDQFSVTAE